MSKSKTKKKPVKWKVPSKELLESKIGMPSDTEREFWAELGDECFTGEKYEVIGHCGRIFNEFEVCDEWKIDDLCQGCPMNDDEELCEEEDPTDE